MINRLNGTFRDTRLAIDALFGMDVQHLFPFIETLDGADHYAVGVAAANAGLSNDMCHENVPFLTLMIEYRTRA